MPDCSKCDASIHVPDGLEFDEGDLCSSCKDERTVKLEAVVIAARNIRHWHDTLNGEGMVVSSNAVRELWGALAVLDSGKYRRDMYLST